MVRSCLTVLLAAALVIAGGRAFAENAELRDGQHDFDWEIGTWKTQLRRLVNPLTGSTSWVEYEGTSVVSKMWDGRANLVELDAEGTSGRIEGLNLRLYNRSPGSGVLLIRTAGPAH